ncbi:hypothetical protein VTO42DRAFT_250 [Malbranchea cinnamomea]
MWHVWNVNPAFTKDGKREIRRRRRDALSCSRCRRLKVRCDRRLPCGHCSRSKRADQCQYSTTTTTTTTTTTSAPKGSQDQTATKRPPQKRFKASSPPLLSDFESVLSQDARNKDITDFSADSMGMSIRLAPSSTVQFAGNFMSFHSISENLAAGVVVNSRPSFQNAGMYAFLNKFRIWNSKYRGETHWVMFVKEFASLSLVTVKVPADSPSKPPPRVRDDEISNYSKLPLPILFPIEYILSIIPNLEEVKQCIENYFCTVEQLYRFLHVPSFRRELQAFWEQDSKKHVDWDWLAQLLMIIGLGYLATPNADIKRVKRLFRGAEICLMQMSFVTRPTILSIKTVCMMVISKHMGAMSCDEYDSCGPLMGIVIRHATSLGLHRDPTHDGSTVSPFQVEMHRRLWSTIVLIEVQQSITSGMPPLIKHNDYDTLPPMNVNDEDLDPLSTPADIVTPRPNDECTDSSFQIIITQSLPPALEIVAEANSLSGTLSYERVLELDKHIRDLLSQASFLRNTLINEPDETKRHARFLQVSMLDISLRRILLILHRQYTRVPGASTLYPTSYWTHLESSLAILVHQRQIYEDELNDWRTMKWFAEIFKNDFFLAAVIVGIHLCKKDNPALEDVPDTARSSIEGTISSPVSPPSSLPSSSPPLSLSPWVLTLNEDVNGTAYFVSTMNQRPMVSPRQTILQALKWCQDIWLKKLTKSFCQSKVSEVLGEVIRSIEHG